jgi:hypothetical protein
MDVSAALSKINWLEMLGLLGPIVFVGFFLLVLLGIAFIIWFFGLLTPRPYKALVLAERGNGFKPFMEKGRSLPSGLFGIWHGPALFGSNESKVQAPLEKMIMEGTVVFIRRAVDDYIPCIIRMGKPSDQYPSGEKDDYGQPIMKQMETVLLDPCMNPAAKLAFANQTIDDARRFSKPGFIEKYGLILMCVVCALILGASFLFSAGMISNTGAKCNANSDAVLHMLQNTTITVVATAPVASTTPKIPGLNNVGTPGG